MDTDIKEHVHKETRKERKQYSWQLLNFTDMETPWGSSPNWIIFATMFSFRWKNNSARLKTDPYNSMWLKIGPKMGRRGMVLFYTKCANKYQSTSIRSILSINGVKPIIWRHMTTVAKSFSKIHLHKSWCKNNLEKQWWEGRKLDKLTEKLTNGEEIEGQK